jgi:hypothetical protein
VNVEKDLLNEIHDNELSWKSNSVNSVYINAGASDVNDCLSKATVCGNIATAWQKLDGNEKNVYIISSFNISKAFKFGYEDNSFQISVIGNGGSTSKANVMFEEYNNDKFQMGDSISLKYLNIRIKILLDQKGFFSFTKGIFTLEDVIFSPETGNVLYFNEYGSSLFLISGTCSLYGKKVSISSFSISASSLLIYNSLSTESRSEEHSSELQSLLTI